MKATTSRSSASNSTTTNDGGSGGSGGSGGGGNVRVCCRVRPQNSLEKQKKSTICVQVHHENQAISLESTDGSQQTFTFDHVFSEESTQENIFQTVARPVVQDLMDGYNATIFAYGQTSSGKTYTMEGASIDDETLRGIIPRTATEIFQNVSKANENIEFIVKISYIEIYMEKIRDLLDPFKSKVNLQVRENAQKGIYVEGMAEICVTNDQELLDTMRQGAKHRQVAATGMNEGSSRSHSVFMVTLYQRNLENASTKNGKLYLVDLAGSEMVRKTGATGKQLEEAKTINKSLSALGMVINALTSSDSLNNNGYIPYRDSKLTRILQESIGGNSRTALIINVSPSDFNAMETLSTLRFGMRAKKIQNKPIKNEQKSMEEYQMELEKKEQLSIVQKKYILQLEQFIQQNGLTIPSPYLPLKNQQLLPVSSSSDDKTTSNLEEEEEEKEKRVILLEQELKEEKEESIERLEEIRLLSVQLEEKNFFLEQSQQLIQDLQQNVQDMEFSLQKKDQLIDQSKENLEKLQFEYQELQIHAEKLQKEFETIPNPTTTGSINIGIINTPPPTTTTRVDMDEKLEEKEDDEEEIRSIILEEEIRKYEKEYRQLQVTSEKEKKQFKEEILKLKAQIRELELQFQFQSTTPLTEEQEQSLPSPAPAPSSTQIVYQSGMSTRERQHLRSVQQKLEQLVAVHRQLLRKYAAIELELTEAKKKLILRDERIKQVEQNNRLMAGNMRAQAEKHVEEMNRIKQYILEVNRSAATTISRSNSTMMTPDGLLIKTIRGGESSSHTGNGGSTKPDNHQMIRPIRGGGRRQTGANESFYGTSTNSGRPFMTTGGTTTTTNTTTTTTGGGGGIPISSATSGFLTRLFGGSSSNNNSSTNKTNNS